MIDKMTIMELLGLKIFKENEPFINGALSGMNQTFEREIVTPAGEVRYALANYFPDIKDNQVVGFFAQVTDITYSKTLEKKNIESTELIKDQNRLLLNFAHLVSHNLGTYSGNISSVLEMYFSSKNKKEKEEFLKYLVNISDQFSDTVKNLTEVVKFNSFENFLKKNVNLFKYVEKTKAILYQQIEQTQALIYNNIDDQISIKLNPAYTESILLNLISNAIKYRHPERKSQIEISSIESNESIIIKIKDNGLGIDMQKNGKSLFEIHRTFHGNSDAQGVGLFITKYQIEKMKGTICAESEVNVGTTFTIQFKK
jgi:signal transduction histidine kinase